MPNLPQEGDPPGQNADRVYWRGGGCGVGFGGRVPLGTTCLERKGGGRGRGGRKLARNNVFLNWAVAARRIVLPAPEPKAYLGRQ